MRRFGSVNQETAARRLRAAGCLIAIAVGIFFRVYALDRKVFSTDEVATAIVIAAYEWDDVRRSVGGRIVSAAELTRFQTPADSVWQGVIALSRVDPHHPPLYFVMAHALARVMDHVRLATRTASVLASLMALGCAYWLAMELGRSRLAAWLTVTIMAASPFHVAYAQEARPYATWTVTTLFASAALLRACRRMSARDWTLYSLALVLLLYTHLLGLVVVAAHGVYIASSRWWNLGLPAGAAKRYLWATGAALAAFSPWMAVVAMSTGHVEYAISWVERAALPAQLVAVIAFKIASLIWDPGLSSIGGIPRGPLALVSYGLAVPILALIVAALLHAARQRRAADVFLLALTAVTLSGLFALDVALGGQTSSVPRFVIPAYCGIQVLLAFFLAEKVSGEGSAPRWWWGATVAVLFASIVSCGLYGSAETWWNKRTGHQSRALARRINVAAPALVIGHTRTGTAMSYTVALSHYLDPDVRVWLVPDSSALRDPRVDGAIFLLRPSAPMLQKMQNEGFSVERQDPDGELWRAYLER